MANKPANEGFDTVPGDRRHAHGHRLRRGEPVGIIISRGKVAHVVDVAEQEGHRAELFQTAACRT